MTEAVHRPGQQTAARRRILAVGLPYPKIPIFLTADLAGETDTTNLAAQTARTAGVSDVCPTHASVGMMVKLWR